MNLDQFVRSRKVYWEELGTMLNQLDRGGPRHLSPPALRRLGRLYRQSASDLAYARTYFPGTNTVIYLNQLVARAHTAVYAEEPQRFKTLLDLFWRVIPGSVRAHWRPILLAFVFVLIGGVVGFIAIHADPNLGNALVPDSIRERIVSPQERYDAPVAERPVVGTAIMINNMKVGVLAFGLGITLGVGTAVTLFYNGLIVGAVVAQAVGRGDSLALWAYLLTHGTLELLAIFLCGGAGFLLGWAILAPGEFARKVAMSRAARQAVNLVLCALLFFAVAATLEGLVTPMHSLGVPGRYLIAFVTGALALAYWVQPGRSKAAPAP